MSDGGNNNDPLAIAPIATRKDKIKQPDASSQDIIPRLTSNVLIVGCSGSGKTTLLHNLIKQKQFFKGWFDQIYLISPSAKTDDIQRDLEVPDEAIIDDLNEAPTKIQELMDEQRDEIEASGAHKAKQIALIYDDVVGANDALLKTEQFTRSFIAARHYNFTTFLLVQSFTQAPRVARLQCQNLFYFRGSNSELEKICEECCAPGLKQKEMALLVDFATIEPYSFLHFNRRVADASQRYRKNLDEVIDIESVKTAFRYAQEATHRVNMEKAVNECMEAAETEDLRQAQAQNPSAFATAQSIKKY